MMLSSIPALARRVGGVGSLVGLVGWGSAPPLAAQTVDSAVAIINVTIVDGRSPEPRRDVTVVVRGNRIVEVGPAATIRSPSGGRVVDGRGRYLVPGLWDAHVHLEHAGVWALPRFIAHGVTGVRDMGAERFEPLRRWRIEILSGARVGPRIVAAGPIVDGPTPNWPLRVTVRDAAESRRTVDSLAAVGVDFIKVHQQLSPPAYFGVAAEARRLNLPFAGHVPPDVSGVEAANSGQRSFEHLTGVPAVEDGMFQETVAALRRNQTWVDPTLSVYWILAHHRDSSVVTDERARHISPTLRQFWDEQQRAWSGDLSPEGLMLTYRSMMARVGALQAAGVSLLTGTDLGFIYVYPGSGVHDELEYLVEAGLSPWEALRTATLNPAAYFGWERDLGTVETGKLADLVLLDADPLMSIRNTRRIRAVIANGRLFERGELDRL